MDTPEFEARHRPRPALQSYLPDLIYGANDGIVTTLVVIASVAGAALSSKVILILGFANLVADGFSMGTSNVLSVRSTLTAATRPRLWDASRNGIATFAAFVIAGLLPLSAYLFPFADEIRLPAACILAAVALFGIGACGRSSRTGDGWWLDWRCWRSAPSPASLRMQLVRRPRRLSADRPSRLLLER